MGPVEQHEMPFAGRRIRNPRLRRGIFLLPSLFTGANLLCGYYAVVASLAGGWEDFDHAAKAIGLAILFDSLDGRVARMTGTNTEFGMQFDSLADVVSFGIAPAVMAYAWGVRSLPDQGSQRVELISQLGWFFCLAFLICCAWRLARFNVQGMAPGGSKNFVGMPTPAAAGVIASLVHGFKFPLQDWHWSVAWIALAGALGALMTSTIRYYSFKDIPWTRKQPSAGYRRGLPPGGGHLEIFRICSGDLRLHVCGCGRGLAHRTFLPPSTGLSDRVIHAIS